jgi:probable F420-dependent oxidoreductase
VRIGLFVVSVNPLASPEYLAALGNAAEERGFAELWLGEHVVLFDEYEPRYPYSSDGTLSLPADTTGMLEPFTALAFLASCTRDIRLGTAVCLVPQRNPVYTAKEVATVDWLSGGRVDLGVGIGWQREEFQAVDAPFPERAARTREYLEVMRTLWEDDLSQHSGPFYELAPCRMFPKPVQARVPVYFGGESEPALRRVADVGEGWHGFSLTPELAKERIARLYELLDERGRARDDVEVAVCPYLEPVGPADLEPYHAAGVDQLVLICAAPNSDQLSAVLDRMVTDYVDPARRLG